MLTINDSFFIYITKKSKKKDIFYRAQQNVEKEKVPSMMREQNFVTFLSNMSLFV
jgi:hypothetical protein